MPDSEETLSQQRGLTPWKPGQSGNPAGRPKGARNKLGEAFIEALRDDFVKHGVAAIVETRETKPDAYVKVIASLLPKEFDLSDDAAEALTNAVGLTQLVTQLSAATGADPETALRALAAQNVETLQ